MTGGRLVGSDAAAESVTSDSRALSAGQLFVALKGPRFDGHAFIEGAGNQGAAGVMVERETAASIPQVLVDDTLKALQRLALGWRGRLRLTVVGLTGSNGKTTVKEMVAAILSREAQVFATRGNLNNHIGVPLTLLSLRAQHAYAVVEMGANHPGEIAMLAALARPDIALITNAAAAHLEGFGSVEGVARAKGEIFQGLRQGGKAVINADDTFASYWRTLAQRFRCISFGFAPTADVRARELAGETLCMCTPAGEVEVNLPLLGCHNARNAMAATAVGIAAGIKLASVKAGLEAVPQVRGRLAMRKGLRGARLLDDSYNANPGSLAAALEALAEQPGERWLVLGDMAELGAEGQRLHQQAGERARAAGVARLYTLGNLSQAAAEAFGCGAQCFDSHAALARAVVGGLNGGTRADVSILIKGSRSQRMEKIVEALLAQEPSSPSPERENAA
jgi:UDP-N-acetylmuramoyl-tripeptide--D-alanyl-D-alanine ligase